MTRALERHEAGEAHVIPIILRPVSWEGAPFSKLQILPRENIPILSKHWENRDEAWTHVVQELRKVIASLKTTTPLPSSPPTSRIWHIPYRRNPLFTGREELLQQLYDRFTASNSSKTVALSQAQAISGLGGIGKTQVALEYAYRYSHQYRYVFWISAATPETLLSDFVKLAPLLSIFEKDVQEPYVTVTAVKKWLTQQRDWLLILDNADDLTLASDYLPDGSNTNGHVLLTTRAQAAGTIAYMLEVEKMDKDEGTLLLLRRARVLAQEAPLDLVREKDRAEAEAIVTALDGLPLALDQAGAYIEETGCSLSDYLNLYQTRRKDLLGRRGQLPPGHPETVLATWSLSFQNVEAENRAAAELLRLCAFLGPDSIPEEIFSAGASVLGSVLSSVAADTYRLNEAIEVLRRYSLLRRNREMKTCTVHRLVQAVLIDRMNQKTQRVWADRVVRTVSRAFPKVEVKNWSRCQQYLPLSSNENLITDDFEEEAKSLEMWEVLRSLIPDEREQRVAYLTFYAGLKPREIARLVPQEFNDVEEIYRLKHITTERLRRNQDSIRWLLGDQ
jgi:hypothetical protein